MVQPSSVVLSTLEFDVLWDCERLPPRHVAVDVPSPGGTASERAELVADTWRGLRDRGLVDGRYAEPELADDLGLLAHPGWAIDAWIWTDHKISGLAVASGSEALLCVVDGDEVWLIPARESGLVEAAVSVAGETPAGLGHSVSVPGDVLAAADEDAGGDARQLITCLETYGIALHEAQGLAGMLAGLSLRGQFGVQRRDRDGEMVRANRVVGLHDTPDGRYVFLDKPSSNGRSWSTITPADNQRIAECVWDVVDELG